MRGSRNALVQASCTADTWPPRASRASANADRLQDVPVAVPRHVFHEVVRIQQVGLPATTSKKVGAGLGGTGLGRADGVRWLGPTEPGRAGRVRWRQERPAPFLTHSRAEPCQTPGGGGWRPQPEAAGC